jgi:hypothetical protein
MLSESTIKFANEITALERFWKVEWAVGWSSCTRMVHRQVGGLALVVGRSEQFFLTFVLNVFAVSLLKIVAKKSL